MKKILGLAMVGFLGLGASAHAVNADDLKHNAYYQLSDVAVTEEIPTAAELANTNFDAFPRPAINTAVWDDILNGDWNTIVLVGKQLIEIIKANQAVVNIKLDTLHAVPAGITDWQTLAGWQPPLTKVFKVTMKNGFGSEVVNVRVKVSATWGGNLDGRGHYLSNVTIVPTETRVIWGWNLDLWSEARQPLNAGTKEDPIASLGI
ncbi:MAG: hypothetical protein EOP11_21110, partial [Proteobacteria bacterium]